MPGNNLKYADEFASEYDRSVLKNNWTGPQVLFTQTKNLLDKGSEILDLGIGTGESAKPFQQAGHRITGMDGSSEMLKQCRLKAIGLELILHNLEKVPFPVEPKRFDAVISNGVFHLIHPIKPVFSEVQRTLKPGGIFAFTFEQADIVSGAEEVESGTWQKKTESDVLTYKHSFEAIRNLLCANNFDIYSQKRFLVFTNKKSKTDFYFTAIVARLQ